MAALASAFAIIAFSTTSIIQPPTTNAIVQLGIPNAPRIVGAAKLIKLVSTRPRKKRNQYLPELILL